MPYKSNLASAIAKFNNARRAALIAGGEVLVTALKDAHRGGHTSGDFVTGNEVNAIYRTDPEMDSDGNMFVRVTTRQTDPPYPWFWVVGHNNLFTGRFERDDRWSPTVATAAPAVEAEHERVFRQVMGA